MAGGRASPWLVLLLGGGLGVLGDVLLRAADAPGLNLFLWAAALALAVAFLGRSGTERLSLEARIWLGVGVLYAASFVVRDAEPLKLVALGATAGAFALAALHAGKAWVRRGGLAEYALAWIASSFYSAVGALFALGDVDWRAIRDGPEHGAGWRLAGAVARGLLLALPLVVIFGGLFIAADPVFAGIVTGAVRVDLEVLASHVALAGFFGWVATGFLRGFFTDVRPEELRRYAPRRPELGIVEIAIPLAVLGVIFALFVAVQFRYLFGGAALVEVTPGLSYAEYARRGFFELVVVVFLTLPLLLAADWLLRRERSRDERLLRGLAGLHTLLLFAIAASAFQRMRLYQEAYGLTEDRFYATSLLIWLSLVLLWFAGTVLLGRRRPFAFGVLVSAFLAVAVLELVGPDAVIARTNLERARAGAPFDAAYVASLSADAVPELIAGFGDLTPADQCRIASRLLRRWAPDSPADWRAWNWSESRARSAVRAREAQLRAAAAAAGSDGECPGG